MSSYLLYTLYFSLVCLIFGSSKQRKNRKAYSVFLIITFGLMWFMMAFRRFDIGNDTSSYLRFFENISSGNFYYDSRVEVGYRWLTRIIAKITTNKQIYLAICASLAFLPELILIKRVSYKKDISVILFWLLACTSMVAIARQSIALGIVIFGYLFWRKQTKLSVLIFIASVIVASFFHTSAIVLIVLPVLTTKPIKPQTAIIFTIISFVLSFTNVINIVVNRFAGSYYAQYLSIQSGWVSAIFLASIGLFAFFLEYYQNKMNFYDPEYSSYIECEQLSEKEENFLRWATVLYTSTHILAVNSGIIGRISAYFTPFLIIYLSNTLCKLKRRGIFIAVFVIIYVIFKTLSLIYRPQWESFFPFYYFWQ